MPPTQFALYCAVVQNLRLSFDMLWCMDTPQSIELAESIADIKLAIDNLLAAETGDDIADIDAGMLLRTMSLEFGWCRCQNG